MQIKNTSKRVMFFNDYTKPFGQTEKPIRVDPNEIVALDSSQWSKNQGIIGMEQRGDLQILKSKR